MGRSVWGESQNPIEGALEGTDGFGLEGSLRAVEPRNGTDGFGLEESLRVVESWNGFEFGLEGSLRVVEPQNGLGLDWRGP